jgi:hypothetical protein
VELIEADSQSGDSVSTGQQSYGEVKNVANASYPREKYIRFRNEEREAGINDVHPWLPL